MGCWFWTTRGFSAVLVAALATAGCAVRAALPTYNTVPDFSLTDQTGASFAGDAALRGHVWVADFMFTNCPGPCPRMSSQMHQVQAALASTDVRLVSFTIDPARDTPAVLADYAAHFSAKPGVWYFLTGPVETLRHLDRDVFQLGDIDGSLDHSTRFVLVDRKARVRGFYLTSEPDAIDRLIADARGLVKDRD
jgi:protein SCO1/2